MKAWETALLLAAVLVPLFLTLNYFGLMVIKSGTFFGGAMGSLSRFWGEYRHLNGSVAKNFWISGKYSTLKIHLEPVSGSVHVEILVPGGGVLYDWHIGWPTEREISCQHLKRCKVRITSQDFAGKFLIFLQ